MPKDSGKDKKRMKEKKQKKDKKDSTDSREGAAAQLMLAQSQQHMMGMHGGIPPQMAMMMHMRGMMASRGHMMMGCLQLVCQGIHRPSDYPQVRVLWAEVPEGPIPCDHKQRLHVLSGPSLRHRRQRQCDLPMGLAVTAAAPAAAATTPGAVQQHPSPLPGLLQHP
jgi:hypothetical protein